MFYSYRFTVDPFFVEYFASLVIFHYVGARNIIDHVAFGHSSTVISRKVLLIWLLKFELFFEFEASSKWLKMFRRWLFCVMDIWSAISNQKNYIDPNGQNWPELKFKNFETISWPCLTIFRPIGYFFLEITLKHPMWSISTKMWGNVKISAGNKLKWSHLISDRHQKSHFQNSNSEKGIPITSHHLPNIFIRTPQPQS